LAAILYVGMFDFFFVAPHFSFAVSDVQYVLTFGVMLAVGLLIGQLTAGVRYQARIAQYREQRSRQLFELAKALSGAVSAEEIAALSCDFVARCFHARTQVVLVDGEGHLLDGVPGADRCPVDRAVAQWCLDRKAPAGLGSDTLPALAQRLLPLTTANLTLGVLVIEPANLRLLMIPEQLRLLDLYGVLIAIALERIALARDAEQAQLKMESERLRNSLLAALSHDLRTPLTVLFGQAEILTLELGSAGLPQAQQAEAIRQQVLDTSRLVNNLLDMARLQSGGLALRWDWQSLPELVGSALRELEVPLRGHPLQRDLSVDLPLLYCDGTMLERVLVNLLENASKYAGVETRIGISARVAGDALEVRVWDQGPGLPEGKEQLIFEKFSRGDKESVIPGVGLGLAICRAIVEAHGGRIWAENRPQGGASFYFTLPLKTPPPLLDEPL
jgi:two-component system, OmpR family, sensor histidine kinase KdpD